MNILLEFTFTQMAKLSHNLDNSLTPKALFMENSVAKIRLM